MWGSFRFLCELDPTNLSLQDYLQLSRLKLEETEEKTSQLQEQAVEKKASAISDTIQSPPLEPGHDLRGVASIDTLEETSHYPDLSHPTQDETSDKMDRAERPETSPPFS